MSPRTHPSPAHLAAAVLAARNAGTLMRRHLHRSKKVHSIADHDVKLALDVRCQQVITRALTREFPKIPVLGEEGSDPRADTAEVRWVVDPIDGTVNYSQGIPHASVSIARQIREGDGYRTDLGVVLDPFQDELWTAVRNRPARRNGRPIRVSGRSRLREAVVSLGFAKSGQPLDEMLPLLNRMAHRVLKIRLMGSAALALAYVADGRFDAYIESGIRLWDIAAGGLLVECAGGTFDATPSGPDHQYRMRAHTPGLRREITRLLQPGS